MFHICYIINKLKVGPNSFGLYKTQKDKIVMKYFECNLLCIPVPYILREYYVSLYIPLKNREN